MKTDSAEMVFASGLSPIAYVVWKRHLPADGRSDWAERWLQGERLWDLQRDFEEILVPYVLEEIAEEMGSQVLALVR